MDDARAPGLIAFRAYLTFFREADELMRKVYVNAPAFVVGVAAGLLGQTDVPKAAKPEWTWSLMVATYAVRLKMLTRKYRA